MEEYNVKILSVEEGISLIKDFFHLSYSLEFFKLIKNKHGFKGGFLAVYKNEEILLVFPVNFLNDELVSVYNYYSEPYFLKNIDYDIWPNIIKSIKRNFKFKNINLVFGFIRNRQNIEYFKVSRRSCYVLQLKNENTREAILKKFNKKTRNEIRKSEKYGFNISIKAGKDLSPEDFDLVYGLYGGNMSRHGIRVKSKEFFHDLFSFYGDQCKIIVSYFNNDLAGVNIAVVHGEYLLLMYNFSDKKYWSGCINNFLYFKMIEWGNKIGIKIFDFGPSPNNFKDLNHFKLGFGAEKIPLVKMVSSKKSYLFKKWIQQKKYNLKIRLNRLSS